MTEARTQTVAFFGASGGVGLAALKHTLSTGVSCVALCRNPAKLAAILSPESNPNLRIVQGNAHDVAAVSACIQASTGVLVDQIVSTIGGAFVASKMSLDDPQVCQKGIATLLEALAALRRGGAVGAPHITVCSTTGLSKYGRDIPIAMIPLYHFMLKVPHEDKIIMENRLISSSENFTIIRPSFMMSEQPTAKKVLCGIEDPKTGRISTAIGYTITKSDAGKWVAENVILNRREAFNDKIVMITT